MTLQPCPNEECRGECTLEVYMWQGPSNKPMLYHVTCDEPCGYSGPSGKTRELAAERHNRMPRTEPWVSVAERMPLGCDLECYVAFSDGTVVGTLSWHGHDWRWSQDCCPFDVEQTKTETHWRPHTPPRGPVSR